MPEVVKARRNFLKTAGSTFCFSVAGVSLQLTPAQARQQSASLSVLSKAQAATLEVLADAIVPGAKIHGIAHFIDSQLAATSADSLLMLKYLGVATPHVSFYTSSLDSLEMAAKSLHQKPIARLNEVQLESLVEAVSDGKLDGWQGPPANFFYFVLRADAIDVVYGTERGFKAIDVPYMAHIKPTTTW